MAMKLENVVPFGRTLAEYRAMFSLTPEDEKRRILSAADGPASFNAELRALGRNVVSLDPVYCFSPEEIRSRFDAVVDNIIRQVTESYHDWVWEFHRSPEELRRRRVEALEGFLKDFPEGLQAGRYVTGSLPVLPFEDDRFDLVLCSHFLFLYSLHFDAEFHLRSMREFLRVGKEVRVFPLLTLAREPSSYLEPVTKALRDAGHLVTIETVPYEFQRGGNQMLRVIRKP